jgi:hypothetical protein
MLECVGIILIKRTEQAKTICAFRTSFEYALLPFMLAAIASHFVGRSFRSAIYPTWLEQTAFDNNTKEISSIINQSVPSSCFGINDEDVGCTR